VLGGANREVEAGGAPEVDQGVEDVQAPAQGREQHGRVALAHLAAYGKTGKRVVEGSRFQESGAAGKRFDQRHRFGLGAPPQHESQDDPERRGRAREPSAVAGSQE